VFEVDELRRTQVENPREGPSPSSILEPPISYQRSIVEATAMVFMPLMLMTGSSAQDGRKGIPPPSLSLTVVTPNSLNTDWAA